jgi:glycosyltransferase involved in cell wall biosynthesis
MQVSIVIPVYNALALTKQCLKSVFEHSSTLSFEVVVVDNGSAPDVERWGRQQQQDCGNLRYLRYSEPLGFAKSVNAGAAVATGEVLIILNSDTLVTPGWMEELYNALMTDPSLGALTPCTNHAGEPAQMDFATVDLPAAKALAMFAKRATHPGRFSVLRFDARSGSGSAAWMRPMPWATSRMTTCACGCVWQDTALAWRNMCLCTTTTMRRSPPTRSATPAGWIRTPLPLLCGREDLRRPKKLRAGRRDSAA